MGRSATSIQTEIASLEALLSTIAEFASVGADGVTKSNQRYEDITKRLDFLYFALDRVTGDRPMIVRGRVKGLGHGHL